ncbi:hypothetical protein BRADI_3g17300v3 [Brachypodium distachyon]|uniref:Uncharacterized protein n=1 Tax=Brachypodium distachyon TaxID=15368 RepID=I1I1P9_BRADI|nr:hypothetical protein BRADI_3g17300v3 [Brachypodium distachyon]
MGFLIFGALFCGARLFAWMPCRCILLRLCRCLRELPIPQAAGESMAASQCAARRQPGAESDKEIWRVPEMDGGSAWSGACAEQRAGHDDDRHLLLLQAAGRQAQQKMKNATQEVLSPY